MEDCLDGKSLIAELSVSRRFLVEAVQALSNLEPSQSLKNFLQLLLKKVAEAYVTSITLGGLRAFQKKF
jgi:hypothetical protein